MKARIATSLGVAWIAIHCGLSAATGQETLEGEITQVVGDLHRFRLSGAYGMFLETPEGIILVDPVNTPTARWLKDELDARYDLPVRYVIYTHHHWDHIEGGWEFEDTAEIVAHENLPEAMARGIAQTQPGASHDGNADAVLTRDEAVTGTLAQFDRLDRNGDGRITGPELFAEIPAPDTVYKDRLTITLGGKTVELIYTGPNHAPDMSLVYFPEERVLFNADLVGLPSIPGGWGAFDRTPINDWIASLRLVEAIDFDVLLHAHTAEFAAPDHVVQYRRFFEDLRDTVAEAVASGMSLDQAKDTISMEQYAAWPGYEAHGFAGQSLDIFGRPVSEAEAAKPHQGIRQAVQAAYLNILAYPVESED